MGLHLNKILFVELTKTIKTYIRAAFDSKSYYDFSTCMNATRLPISRSFAILNPPCSFSVFNLVRSEA